MGKRADRSKEMYNKMAQGYDTSPEGKYTRPHKAKLIEQAVIRDGYRILDVACGNGFLLGTLSKKAQVTAFGVDISENMIAAARERYPDCTFAVQPSAPLGFENNSMDVITVSCGFHHFEDPQAFAAECMRVLKRNGRVYMAEPAFSPLVRWLANRLIYPFSKSGDVKVYSQKELETFFQSVGFTYVETYTSGTVLFFSAKKE